MPTDVIVIQFPAIFQMDSSKQATVCASLRVFLPSNPSNLNAFGAIGCSLALNVLKLSNIFISNQSPTLLTIKVNITNPKSPPK